MPNLCNLKQVEEKKAINDKAKEITDATVLQEMKDKKKRRERSRNKKKKMHKKGKRKKKGKLKRRKLRSREELDLLNVHQAQQSLSDWNLYSLN